MSPHIRYEEELNPQQYAVVTAEDGPALVIAGTGSGKTRALTYRVAYLLDKGVDPRSILLATFTNKAAREMLCRVEGLSGEKARSVLGGTFHHIAHLILRARGYRVGIERSFTILDREDAESLINQCIKEFMPSRDKRVPRGEVLAAVFSYGVNMMKNVENVIEERFPHLVEFTDEIKRVATRYQSEKLKNNALDFDDLLYYFFRLLKDCNDLREVYSSRFRYVLVDEYQDTSRIQAEIVDLLSSLHRNIMVVGDDSQSIYSFRGANPDNMFTFLEKYPEASVYKLEINYRSIPEILELANASIQCARKVYPKRLTAVKPSGELPEVVYVSDEFHEARYIADNIVELERDGVPIQEIAVLYRAHYQSMALQMELTRRGIPFEVRSGPRFFEQAHVKDVLAYLRIACNPRDELAWKRVLKLYPGIGSRTADKVWSQISEYPDPLAFFLNNIPTVKQRTGKRSLEHLLQVLKAISTVEMKNNPSAAIAAVINKGYDDYMKTHFVNYQARKDDLNQLVEYARSFPNMEQLLAEMALVSHASADELQESEGARERVILTTIHQAKGLEWDAVFILGLNEGRFPSARALKENPENEEEERRLFYVAVTRARKILKIFIPRASVSRRDVDRLMLKPSRFIQELPPHLYEEVDLSGVFIRNFEEEYDDWSG